MFGVNSVLWIGGAGSVAFFYGWIGGHDVLPFFMDGRGRDFAFFYDWIGGAGVSPFL